MKQTVDESHLLERVKQSKGFWAERLSNSYLENVVMHDYDASLGYKKANMHISIDSQTCKKILQLSKNVDFLTYTIMLSTFQIQFYRYINKNSIIHVPAYQKNENDKINNICLPLISMIEDNMKIKELIGICKNELLEVYRNQYYLLEDTLKNIHLKERSTEPSQFLISMNTLHKKQNIESPIHETKNQINIRIEKQDNNISLEITYNANLYKENTIKRLINRYSQVLDIIVNNMNAKVNDIDILTEEEKYEILYRFNNTKKEYPKYKTIQEIFEEEAELKGERIAVVSNGVELSYQELNQRANQLARVLRKKGITRDSIVPVLCDKSVETIVAMVAVIKAGGAYLPIDEEYPEARIRYLLEDSRSTVLLGKKETIHELNLGGISVEVVALTDAEVKKESKENLKNINVPGDLAYAIYTSGTTGNPKGVCIDHRAVIKNTKNTNYIKIQKDDRFLQAGSLSFDAAVLPTWLALLNGIPLHLEANEMIMNFHSLSQYILKQHITLTVLPTTLFNQFSQEKIEAFEKIRYVIAGGDIISSQQVSRLVKTYKDIKVVNGYGPTENTVISTACIITDEWDENKTVPIGKPVTNSTAYIMDKNNKLLPIGVPGELCVGGDGVARGYLNREELTSEKFILNPYVEGERIYKTGDLARWLPDGNLEFLGRIDHQVKIRGYRIELGEIEKQLIKHFAVKEAVVIDRKSDKSEKYLCGYIVSEDDISTQEIKEELKKELPDYMIPTYIMQLEKLPLTPNGKIDKKALPEPNLSSIENEYVAPRNEIEITISRIWYEVLGIEKVGVKDNFFELGGHSLKATSLVSKIHREYDMDISISTIFDKPSIEQLAEYIQEYKKSSQKNDIASYYEIESVPKSDYYSASPVQKRMYAIHQMDTFNRNYNMPCVFQLNGNFNIVNIENILNKLIKRHESLRTTFHVINGEVVQKVHDEMKLKLECIYINGKLTDKKMEVDKKIDAFIRPFDLEQAPLVRGSIIQLMDTNLFLIDFHHIISDGVSMGILIRELKDLYEGQELKPLRVQYKDFTNWQNTLYETRMMKKQENYWLERFNDNTIPIVNMPTDYKRSAMQDQRGDNVTVHLEKELTSKIKKILKKTGTTKYMFYLAIFNLLLSKYSNQDDIILGSPTAGRTHASLDNMVGMFVNTLAMRNKPNGNKTFNKFLQEVKQNSLEAFENQEYDFQMLVEKLDIKKEKNRNPLFDVMFSVENFEDDNLILGDLKLSRYDIECDICKFDILLDVFQDNLDEKDVVLNFNFNTSIYKKETIMRLSEHFINIIKVVIKDLNINIKDIDVVNDSEKNLVREFNMVNARHIEAKTIHELFEEQILKTPNQVAVRSENTSLTYKQLNEKANSLARLLRKKGITRESIVAIMVDRSVLTVVGMLAVMKAGGAYLPVDPDYPADRKNYMLKDSNAKILISHKDFMESVCFEKEIIDICDESIYEISNENLDNINQTNDLVYVIYTSGTTGKPKAVMVEHRNLKNIAESWKRDYQLTEMNVKLLQMASFSFDVFTGDVCRALLNGGEMIICPKNIRIDPMELYNLIYENKISIFESTPGLILTFMDYVYENNLPLESLQVLILGSDTCSVEDFNKLNDQYGKRMRILNSYGITEATIDSSFFEVNGEKQVTSTNVPIGKPMQNTKFYVLDNNLKMLPIGVYGELYIGGDGVTRGYLNNEELTREKFIDDPFEKGSKMYRTGDMARWLSDGNIELLGRIDNQVKIRGYRIELGEIESQLLKHKEIKEAVVLAKKHTDGSNYLIGYVVSENELTGLEVKKYLQGELPSYMVPTAIINLEQMPLTPNEKIDRKQLSEINLEIDVKEYIAPRDEIEQKMTEIWCEVLGVNKVGVKENFFDLGGHSLKAVRLISKIYKIFNVRMKVADLFDKPTIEELSKCLNSNRENLENLSKNNDREIRPVEKKIYYTTSAVQKRLYAINQRNPQSTNYNMPDVFLVKGNFNKNQFENALKELINRHESLRTSFHVIDGEIVQKVHEKVAFKLEYLYMRDKSSKNEREMDRQIKKFIRIFDLGKAPLIRAGIIEFEDTSILIIDIHHIIGDGVSTEIMFREIVDLYNKKELNKVEIQYKDFANWQNQLYESNEMQKQEEFWLKEFEGDIPILDMPADYKRPLVQNFEGKISCFEIDTLLAEEINGVVKRNGVTKFMFFLAVYNILLSKYSSQEEIIIGSPTVGRTHESLNNTVGMFLNTLPLKNSIQSNKSFKDILFEIKNNCLKMFENQEYDLVNLLTKLNIQNSIDRNPLFDVMFTLQNSNKKEFTIGEANLISYLSEHNTSKFDLSLFIFANENDTDISGMFEYKTALYKEETINRLIKHYINILKKVVENVNISVGEIEIITEEEKRKLINDSYSTLKEYPKHSTLKELFEQQVKRTPENIAVTYKGDRINYKDLNRKANQLARLLRNKGIGPNDAVGIFMDRSIETIIAVIGVIKSGAACLPISNDYPENRIKHILEDSNATIIIANQNTKDKIISNKHIEIVFVNNEWNFNNECTSNLSDVNSCEDLSYIIYTSGTTGKPKGVMQTHMTLNNLVHYQYNHTNINFAENVMQFANIGFDVFFQEIFSTLLKGGQLCIINDEDKKDIKNLYQFIEDYEIDVIFLPTAYLKFIFSNKKYSQEFPINIKHIVTAGEVLVISDLLKSYINDSEVSLHNHYGPSETHVVTTHTIKKGGNIPGIPSIGKPIMNSTIYILNNNLQLQPIGVPGELYIAGDCLAKGYLKNKKLTRERFIESPFTIGERLYKTGDLAKWLPDGNIEYLGRQDHQVKIRGFRVELGEIQKQIIKYKSVQEAAVFVKEEHNKHLCAYYVADKELSPKELNDYLLKELPNYMIPVSLIQVDEMPLTLNGKIDKSKLLEIQGSQQLDKEYVGTSTETEKKLEEIWKKILKIDKIGLNDNFFDIGGNSILILSMLSHLDALYPNKVRVADIFANPTLKKLAQFIDSSELKGNQSIVLKGLNMPQHYFVDKSAPREGCIFEYEITGMAYEKLATIAEKQNISIEVILVSVKSFILNKISDVSDIIVYSMFKEANTIQKVEFDFSNLRNFNVLFEVANTNLSEEKSQLNNILENPDNIIKYRDEIITIIYDKGRISDESRIKKVFDISIEIDNKKDSIIISCDYNKNKLNQLRIKELFDLFIKTINMLIHKY